jgi:hypothetical protein
VTQVLRTVAQLPACGPGYNSLSALLTFGSCGPGACDGEATRNESVFERCLPIRGTRIGQSSGREIGWLPPSRVGHAGRSLRGSSPCDRFGPVTQTLAVYGSPRGLSIRTVPSIGSPFSGISIRYISDGSPFTGRGAGGHRKRLVPSGLPGYSPYLFCFLDVQTLMRCRVSGRMPHLTTRFSRSIFPASSNKMGASYGDHEEHH